MKSEWSNDNVSRPNKRRRVEGASDAAVHVEGTSEEGGPNKRRHVEGASDAAVHVEGASEGGGR